MSSQLDRILRFAQKTGDKVIVTDSNGREPVVIMPLHAYEDLVALDWDFAEASQDIDEIDIYNDLPDEFYSSNMGVEDDLALETMDPGPEMPAEEQIEAIEPVETTPVPENEPKLAENTDDEDVGEEEQFYLEPVQ